MFVFILQQLIITRINYIDCDQLLKVLPQLRQKNQRLWLNKRRYKTTGSNNVSHQSRWLTAEFTDDGVQTDRQTNKHGVQSRSRVSVCLEWSRYRNWARACVIVSDNCVTPVRYSWPIPRLYYKLGLPVREMGFVCGIPQVKSTTECLTLYDSKLVFLT